MGNGIVKRHGLAVDDSLLQRDAEDLPTLPISGNAALSQQSRRQLTRSLGVPCHRSYIFADFRFERPIGSGRMCKVYLAHSMKMASNSLAGFPRYAIKEVPVGQMTRQQLLEFRYELYLLSHLQHPHLPRLSSVYDVHGTENQVGNGANSRSLVYVVMEHLNGGELLPALCRQRQYMESDVVRLIRQLTSAVSYLHSQGVAHGSLVPENLILTQAGSLESALRIVDFGHAESELHHHPSPSVGGDLSHLQELRVPEILHHYSSYGIHSQAPTNFSVREKMAIDVWCVGALTHLLLSGMLPGDDRVEDGAVYEENQFTSTSDGQVLVSFKASRWTYASDDAKAFLRFILQIFPHDRPHVDELSRHAWLSPDDVPVASPSAAAAATSHDQATGAPPTAATANTATKGPRRASQSKEDVIVEGANEDLDDDADVRPSRHRRPRAPAAAAPKVKPPTLQNPQHRKQSNASSHSSSSSTPPPSPVAPPSGPSQPSAASASSGTGTGTGTGSGSGGDGARNVRHRRHEDEADDDDDLWSVHNHYDLSTILPHLRTYYQRRITQQAFASLSKVPVTAHSTRYSEMGERFILCDGGLPFLIPPEEAHEVDENLRQIWSQQRRSKRLQAVANALANMHGL